MTGYTRNDTANNIDNGNVIDAVALDGEFNAIEAAFNNTTGHTHDGTSAGGAPITKVGPGQDVTVTAVAVLPKTHNTIDLGVTANRFKNSYFAGTVSAADGFTGDLTGNVVGNFIGNVTGSLVGDVTGVSSSAIEWETPRSITLTGGVSGVVSGIDGTADVFISTTVADNSHNHTTSTITDFTSATQAVVGAMVSTNTESGIVVSYAAGKLNFDVLDPIISLSGDVAGSASMTNLGNVTINTTIQPNSVTLGVDTTGNYVGSVAAGTGVTVTGAAGEGYTPIVSIGQAVATTSNVTFGSVTSSGSVTSTDFQGPLTGNASTASKLQTARSVSLTGDVVASGIFDGSNNLSMTATIQPNSVALGTDTTGNYIATAVGGTGVTITGVGAENATANISIGQNVATTADVTFHDLHATGSVLVDGDLTVTGTTTTVNTQTVSTSDTFIVLNNDLTTAPTENAGITINRGTSADKSLLWDEGNDRWTIGSETFVAGSFVGPLTGNASTATILQTARTIGLSGDVSGSATFNGGSNITIVASVADDSHNHIIANVDGLQAALDGKADTTHTHIISDVTNLQTTLDGKAAKAGSSSQAFAASTLTSTAVNTATATISSYLSVPTATVTTANITTVDLGDWTIYESAGVLYFAKNGVKKMKLDESGNLTVTGNVTGYGTV
jgi:hypothetical protein